MVKKFSGSHVEMTKEDMHRDFDAYNSINIVKGPGVTLDDFFEINKQWTQHFIPMYRKA